MTAVHLDGTVIGYKAQWIDNGLDRSKRWQYTANNLVQELIETSKHKGSWIGEHCHGTMSGMKMLRSKRMTTGQVVCGPWTKVGDSLVSEISMKSMDCGPNGCNYEGL